jgi:hypothetical protein
MTPSSRISAIPPPGVNRSRPELVMPRYTSDGSQARLLSEIFGIKAKCGANIFATSRFIPAIIEKFKGSISLEIRASSEDVRRYLDNHMFRLPDFVGRSPELQEEIKSKIIQSVQGMYVAWYHTLDERLISSQVSPCSTPSRFADWEEIGQGYINHF